jgi:hypothetical protein
VSRVPDQFEDLLEDGVVCQIRGDSFAGFEGKVDREEGWGELELGI